LVERWKWEGGDGIPALLHTWRNVKNLGITGSSDGVCPVSPGKEEECESVLASKRNGSGPFRVLKERMGGDETNRENRAEI